MSKDNELLGMDFGELVNTEGSVIDLKPKEEVQSVQKNEKVNDQDDLNLDVNEVLSQNNNIETIDELFIHPLNLNQNS